MICECMKAEDGTAVLILKVDESERAFYRPAAEAFARAAKEKLYPAALADYAACPDRRKRYRFRAWTASFSAADHGDETELCISVNGEVLRHERHLFDGELLMKRERISDNL